MTDFLRGLVILNEREGSLNRVEKRYFALLIRVVEGSPEK